MYCKFTFSKQIFAYGYVRVHRLIMSFILMVTTAGYMTAYSEAPWSPNKGLNNGKDMQWGGGTLFVSDDEKKDDKTGK